MELMLRAFRIRYRQFSELLYNLIVSLPYFHFIKYTDEHANGVTFKLWFFQKVLGFNRQVYWPVDHRSKINQWRKIHVGIDVAPGIEPGCYIQGLGEIYIGDYTLIAQNVGIISANHSLSDYRVHERKRIDIGKYCWIGMNSTILPGVKLGDRTIVGAGSVVTSSFEEGYCVIAGVPAKKIKDLSKEEFVIYQNKNKYHGYIRSKDFETFKQRKLWLR